jgi:hypothetical protein
MDVICIWLKQKAHLLWKAVGLVGAAGALSIFIDSIAPSSCLSQLRQANKENSDEHSSN